MMVRAVFSGMIIVMFTWSNSSALDVAGVSLPETVKVEYAGDVLVLQSANVRKKLFSKVYVEALYLPDRVRNIKEILAIPGAKRMAMHFLYSEITAERLLESMKEGFLETLTDDEFRFVQDRLRPYISLIRVIRRGDIIRLDYLPEVGTLVWYNNELLSTIGGEDFYRCILKVWLSEKA